MLRFLPDGRVERIDHGGEMEDPLAHLFKLPRGKERYTLIAILGIIHHSSSPPPFLSVLQTRVMLICVASLLISLLLF